MSLDIALNRIDRVYRPGDRVTGAIVISSDVAASHNGIKLSIDGNVTLQLNSAKAGMFESLQSNTKSLPIAHLDIDVSSGGKLLKGNTEFPFEFILKPINQSTQLFDTYHGVYVNIAYQLTATMNRGMMAKAVTKQREILVEVDPSSDSSVAPSAPFSFTVSPASLQNIKEKSKGKIPDFMFDGFLVSTNCDLNQPLCGELRVMRTQSEIRSIELQLVRVESCLHGDVEAREATEIQNIQIADGPILPNTTIPIYMIFPRLFTCCTTKAKQFRIEFEVNLIIAFADQHMITENFMLALYRQPAKK